MAAVDPYYEPEPIQPIPPDPREFIQILASRLIIDKRSQRDVDPDRQQTMSNEWDWERAEVPTVTANGDGFYMVDEGQHRVGAIKHRDEMTGADTLIWCAVLPSKIPADRAQLALDIANGRRNHTAYEKWNLRYNAGHAHEVLATDVMRKHTIRLGRSTSAQTIGAVATVKTIVHGSSQTPEYGATLLDNTLWTIKTAFPDHDPESNTSRWDRYLLLAVAGIIHRNPDANLERLARSLRVRPAPQWVSLGQPSDVSPHQQIASKLMDGYNKGLRRGRLDW